MKIRVETLRYSEDLCGFTEGARRAVTFGREVLKAIEHVIGFNGFLKNLVSKEGSFSGANLIKSGGNWGNNADNRTSSNWNNNPSNENNNGFRLVSTVSEQIVFHFDTPAFHRCGDERAQPRPASGTGERQAGNILRE